MSSDTEREAFEAWITERLGKAPALWDSQYPPGTLNPHFIGRYVINSIQDQWSAWQARASIAVQPPAASQPSDEGEREIIATYNALHANKLGAHWLWVVIEQIAAGVPEDEAMEDFGYFEFAKSLCPPKRPAGEVAKDARHPLYVAVMEHCDDLDRCVPMLRGHGLKRLANEVAKAAKELRAAICGPSAPGAANEGMT